MNREQQGGGQREGAGGGDGEKGQEEGAWVHHGHTGGIIWEVEGRGSGSKGVAYHADSPTQVKDLGSPKSSTWVGESV